ncbi:hypothetical protein F4859DRAFT_399290 [Xylaria cf. heliscus]|nr:hypothetical protein F4859DRAFT_399290 [Xylaria cf. heliscus]
MCRRIITHRMHHDVATPMLIDPFSSTPIIYANPLRTNFHRCELTPPPGARQAAECPYHTCCIADERIDYCASVGDSAAVEPEECPSFALEHRHERLPYFGDAGAYDTAVPATWQDMVRARGSNAHLFLGFATPSREAWEWEYFIECEKLYMLERDTATLFANFQDLRADQQHPRSRDMERVARVNFRRVEARLFAQRKLMAEMWSSISFGGQLSNALATLNKGMPTLAKDGKS